MQKKHSKNIIFLHDYRSLPFPRKRLKKTAEEIFQNEKNISNKAVNVILCSDYKIKKLNNEYRKTNYPTDVLSFNFNDNDFLGEIYISLQRAAVQARRYNISYTDEVNRLLIHGFFHLLGFDHKTKKERKIMEVHEQRYF